MWENFSKFLIKNDDERESLDFEEIFKSFIYKKKLAFIVFILSFTSINILYYFHKKLNPIYQGSFEILIQDPISTANGLGRFTEGIEMAALGGLNNDNNFPTIVTYLKSESILSKVANENSYDPSALASKITITQGGEKKEAIGVLNISLKIDDPKKGEKILNDLSKVFIESSLSYRNNKLENGISFINNERPDFEKKILLATSKLNNYKDKYEVISNTVLDELRVINVIRKDDLIKDKIQTLLLNNEKIKNSQEFSSKEKIKENNLKISKYKQQLNEIKNEFKNPSQLIKNIEDLVKEIELNTIALRRIVALSESYRLELAQNSIPWTIISNPKMSYNPTAKSLSTKLIYSGFPSILITLFTVFVNLSLKNVFKYPEEIEKYYSLRNFGIIGNDIEKAKFDNSIQELCLTLKAFKNQKEFTTLFITSSVQQEGKTKINVAVAKNLSDMGEKVLLIDTNSIQPKVHKEFNLSQSPGLLDINLSKDLKIESLIKKSKYNNQLDVITAGICKEKLKLNLYTQKMKEFINDMKKNYSYIIYDGESINDSPSSVIDSELADKTILLISTRYVNKKNVKLCLKKLLKFGVNIEGMLINELI